MLFHCVGRIFVCHDVYLVSSFVCIAEEQKEKALQEAEDKVTQLEAAIRILEDQMSTPEGSQDVSLYEKHGKLKAQLKQAEEEWEKLI